MSTTSSTSPSVAGSPPALEDHSRWFKENIQPHEPHLRNWLKAQFLSLPDHDDVVQESYLRLLRARAQGKVSRPKSFLFSVAWRVAMEACRSRRVHAKVSISELPESVSTEAGAFAALDSRQRLEQAIAAIDQLPERCREIVLLRTQEKLSYEEIAARLGISEETARVQMSRGIQRCLRHVRFQTLTEDKA